MKIVGNTKDIPERTLSVLEEILKWTRVTAIPKVKEILLAMLPTDEEKVAYHCSTGRNSRRVAKKTGVDHTTIARWWKKWYRARLGEIQPVKGGGSRFVRSFSLENFGIEVPSLKKIVSSTQTPHIEEAVEKTERETNDRKQ